MGLDADVTLRSLSLGDRDATTGLRLPSYSESTIKAIDKPRGASTTIAGVGFYAREDRMFLAAAPAYIGDQIKKGSTYYEIKTKQKHDLLDSHLCYEYQCSELDLWEAVLEEGTWTTSPKDPRAATKEYVDANVTDANVTKNDNSTEASWACIFENPIYPMIGEFRAASAAVQGLFVVGQPTTTSDLGVRYTEKTPVDIYTVDSNDCGGDQLRWKMEAEWRDVIENNPISSLRTLDTRRGDIIDLGSTKLYHIPTVMHYRRTSERGKA